MATMKIKKGDTVKVIAGKDVGAEGKVLAVDTETVSPFSVFIDRDDISSSFPRKRPKGFSRQCRRGLEISVSSAFLGCKPLPERNLRSASPRKAESNASRSARAIS